MESNHQPEIPWPGNENTNECRCKSIVNPSKCGFVKCRRKYGPTKFAKFVYSLTT
jgi:hypothetical protein